MDDEEVALVRQKLTAVREAWFKRNEEEVMKRWAFEEAVSLSKHLCGDSKICYLPNRRGQAQDEH